MEIILTEELRVSWRDTFIIGGKASEAGPPAPEGETLLRLVSLIRRDQYLKN